MTKESNPVGRPTEYRKEYCEQVKRLSLLGLTDKEMAEFFGVSEVTLNAWKNKFPEFLKSMHAGKLAADAEIAYSLYDRAKGAQWTEQAAFKIRNQTGSGVFTEEVKIIDLIKAAPPDTQAASLWLRNRRPKDWRDKVDHEITGKDGVPLSFTINIGDAPDADA